MKVLLDECVPRPFGKQLPDYECHDGRSAGFGGKKNGELLASAEAAGFDVLLTVDQSIPYQQNLAGKRIAIVILKAVSNRLPDLLPHVPSYLRALRSIRPGQVLRVG